MTTQVLYKSDTDIRESDPQMRKAAVRAALCIHECLLQPRPGPDVRLPESTWNNCVDLARRIEKARQHRWHVAERSLSSRLAGMVELLRAHLSDIPSRLELPVPAKVSMPQQIFRDLLALDGEFEEVEIVLDKKEISVTTDVIQLEDLYLGPFKIELNWGRPAGGQYEVVAVDPQPSARDMEVVHPHVQGVKLCEGDARLPIRQALQQGRLFDFFLIVRQTLQTYNAGSAYVRISEWNGVHCPDCDAAMDDDEGYSCERCCDIVCDECSTSCSRCGRVMCNSCSVNCPACDQPFCSDCLQPCAGCEAHHCQECLTDERCSDCRQSGDRRRSVDKGAGIEPEAEDPAAGAALQPERVGQAGVPA